MSGHELFAYGEPELTLHSFIRTEDEVRSGVLIRGKNTEIMLARARELGSPVIRQEILAITDEDAAAPHLEYPYHI